MKKSWLISTVDEFGLTINEFERFVLEALQTGAHLVTVKRFIEGRSLPQNRSLHLYCKIMAKLMNEAGYTQRQLVNLFREGFELPVTQHMIKEIFRQVGLAMYEKDSTAKLSTVEITDIYKTVDARFGEVTGIRHEWPSKESMRWANA